MNSVLVVVRGGKSRPGHHETNNNVQPADDEEANYHHPHPTLAGSSAGVFWRRVGPNQPSLALHGVVFERPRGARARLNKRPEVTTMEDANQTAAYRLTITVDGVELPVHEEMRHALLGDLRAAIQDRLVERHGVEVDQDDITVATGYRYAQVPAECPLCSERLDLLSVHLDTENGAYASAMCSSDHCEWSGDAVYRIIDLEGSESNAVESSVLTGDITPSYSPY